MSILLIALILFPLEAYAAQYPPRCVGICSHSRSRVTGCVRRQHVTHYLRKDGTAVQAYTRSVVPSTCW